MSVTASNLTQAERRALAEVERDVLEAFRALDRALNRGGHLGFGLATGLNHLRAGIAAEYDTLRALQGKAKQHPFERDELDEG
jgi:hypothetical protein